MKFGDIYFTVQKQLCSFAEQSLEDYAESDAKGKILYLLGAVCYEQGKYEKAFEWYKKAIEKGNGRAIYQLGCMYRDGHAVPQNDKKALECFRIAAEEFECIDAMYELGIIYFSQARAEKFGVDKDIEKAMKLLIEASYYGNYKASSLIARHYYQETDLELAYDYAIKAYYQVAYDLKPYRFFEFQNLENKNCIEVVDDFENKYGFKIFTHDEISDLISKLCEDKKSKE